MSFIDIITSVHLSLDPNPTTMLNKKCIFPFTYKALSGKTEKYNQCIPDPGDSGYNNYIENENKNLYLQEDLFVQLAQQNKDSFQSKITALTHLLTMNVCHSG